MALSAATVAVAVAFLAFVLHCLLLIHRVKRHGRELDALHRQYLKTINRTPEQENP